MLSPASGLRACPHPRPNKAVAIRAHPAPSDRWIDVLKPAHPTAWQADLRMLSQVTELSAFVTAYLGGVVVSVADSGPTGVFHLATVPRAQGFGVAHTVLGAISA